MSGPLTCHRTSPESWSSGISGSSNTPGKDTQPSLRLILASPPSWFISKSTLAPANPGRPGSCRGGPPASTGAGGGASPGAKANCLTLPWAVKFVHALSRAVQSSLSSLISPWGLSSAMRACWGGARGNALDISCRAARLMWLARRLPRTRSFCCTSFSDTSPCVQLEPCSVSNARPWAVLATGCQQTRRRSPGR